MRAWDYPYETVIIACDVCGRYGKYSKERFIELVGASTSLPDARRILAHDCKKRQSLITDVSAQCGVHYPDLGRDRSTAAERHGQKP